MSNKTTEEQVNKGLKLLVKSSFIVFIGLFLSKVLTYVYRIIIARYFGPEVYGLFSLTMMVLGWFVAISSLGLVDGLGRFIALYRGKKEYNKIKYLLSISAIILFFSSIIAAIILFFSAEFISINFFHNSNLIIFLKIFSFLIPILIFSNFLLCILRAFEKIAWHSFILNILQNIMKLVVLVLFIFLGLKTTSIIFSYFLGTLIMFLAAYLVCKYKISEIFGKYKLNKKIKKKTIKNFTSYSFPLLFLSIFSLLFAWIDSFSIGYLMGVLAVGFYNAAIPIALLMGVIPELFGFLFSPLIIRNFSQKNFKVIKELSQQVAKWIFIFNLPLFLIIILFPGAIINILFGSNYIIAENALRILIIGYFISSLSYVSGNLVGMMGKSKLILMNIVVTSIINLILNFILVPKYGINGAAISTSIVWVILSLALLFEANYYTKIIPLKRKLIKIFLISLLPLFLLLLIKQFIIINLVSLILLGLLFILSYLALIFITGCLDKNDLMILRSLKRRVLSY